MDYRLRHPLTPDSDDQWPPRPDGSFTRIAGAMSGKLPEKAAAYSPPTPGVGEIFRVLRDRWKADTAFSSSVTEIVMNPSYLQIIGLGSEVLPYIFEELKNEPDHWFIALEAITRENPIDEQHAGDLNAMAGDWLTWKAQPRLDLVCA